MNKRSIIGIILFMILLAALAVPAYADSPADAAQILSDSYRLAMEEEHFLASGSSFTLTAADGIESSDPYNIQPTSAGMDVTLSVTEATAASGYNWGIAYSSDENFHNLRDENVTWQRWGWNPSNNACTLICGADLSGFLGGGLVPVEWK